MIDYNEEVQTWHALIDAQHRMLIAYVNRMEGAWQHANPTREEVELFVRFVEFLGDFCLAHFREEEDCMLRFRCPVHKDAQAAHAEFLTFYREFKLRFGIKGYRAELVQELFEACASFIQQHILKAELQLRQCKTPFYGLSKPDQAL